MTPSKHAGYAATWYVCLKPDHVVVLAMILSVLLCFELVTCRYSFSVAAAAMAYFRFKKGNAAIRPKKR